MKARWTPLIFAAGLGAGWLIFGGGTRESAEAAKNKSAAPVVRKSEAPTVTSPHESKFHTFAKELPKLSEDEREAFTKSLTPGDRAAAIEAMLDQAGPDGIPVVTHSMIVQILMTWASEDFDGAWAWARQVESDGDRKFVASQILDVCGGKDPDRALALHLEMAAEDPDFSSSAPLDILQKAASKDAASYLDLLGKLPFGKGVRGRAMDFAADFDFQQAADGLTDLKKRHDRGYPSAFATNFLASWASRDVDAAYAWFAKNPDPFFYENFCSLLEGIEKLGVPGASYAWAADKLNEPGPARDAMIQSLMHPRSSRGLTDINFIAQAMPDAASRDSFLSDVMTIMRGTRGEIAIEFIYVLSQMSTPAVRMETFRQLGKNSLLRVAKIPDAQLQQWGLTRQQIEQAQASGR